MDDAISPKTALAQPALDFPPVPFHIFRLSMISLLRRHPVLFLLFLFGLATWLGADWLAQGPGSQELFLALAKAADFEQGCLSVHGPAWWTPASMQGYSLAGIWSNPLSFAALEAGRLCFGPLAGYKVVGLLALIAAGWTLYRFVRALTGNEAAAIVAGGIYALSPELAIRLAGVEHLGIALCFPLAPLPLHALLRLQRSGRLSDALRTALALGLLFLTTYKVAVLLLPVVAGFGLWLYATAGGPAERRAFALRCGQAALVLAALAVPPVLPLLREQRWMALFAFDPMAGWQHTFAIKTALSWFDRGGELLGRTPYAFHASANAFYCGLAGTAALAAVWLDAASLRSWLATREGSLCRLFCALALGLQWLSYGPLSVWGAHREILRNSNALPSWSILLLWLALAAQTALAVALAAPWVRHRAARALVAAAYLFVPAFSLASLLPLYRELRAPAAFWGAGGTLCLAVAAALALSAVLNAALARWGKGGAEPKPGPRGLAVAALLALVWLDFSGYQEAFGKGELPEGTYADFLAGAAFLRGQPEPGSILALSGRYFYLQLPQLTGRPIFEEAATSYFQARAARELAEAGRRSAESLELLLDDAGVRFVLIDKTDPDLVAPLAELFRSHAPTVFENAHFAVLARPRALGPVRATGRVQGAPSGTDPAELLAATSQDIWPVEPGRDGRPAENGNGTPSVPLSLLQPRFADYQTIRVAPTPPGRPWIVVAEAWHPDWEAEADGKPLPVQRALGCWLAAKAPRDGAQVTFRFRPPAWYDGCLVLTLLAWVATVAAWRRARRREARTA